MAGKFVRSLRFARTGRSGLMETVSIFLSCRAADFGASFALWHRVSLMWRGCFLCLESRIAVKSRLIAFHHVVEFLSFLRLSFCCDLQFCNQSDHKCVFVSSSDIFWWWCSLLVVCFFRVKIFQSEHEDKCGKTGTKRKFFRVNIDNATFLIPFDSTPDKGKCAKKVWECVATP